MGIKNAEYDANFESVEKYQNVRMNGVENFCIQY